MSNLVSNIYNRRKGLLHKSKRERLCEMPRKICLDSPEGIGNSKIMEKLSHGCRAGVRPSSAECFGNEPVDGHQLGYTL